MFCNSFISDNQLDLMQPVSLSTFFFYLTQHNTKHYYRVAAHLMTDSVVQESFSTAANAIQEKREPKFTGDRTPNLIKSVVLFTVEQRQHFCFKSLFLCQIVCKLLFKVVFKSPVQSGLFAFFGCNWTWTGPNFFTNHCNHNCN